MMYGFNFVDPVAQPDFKPGVEGCPLHKRKLERRAPNIQSELERHWRLENNNWSLNWKCMTAVLFSYRWVIHIHMVYWVHLHFSNETFHW